MSNRLENVPSEYLSRRRLAAARLKDSAPSESESRTSLQRLIEGKIDERWYIDIRQKKRQQKGSDTPLRSA